MIDKRQQLREAIVGCGEKADAVNMFNLIRAARRALAPADGMGWDEVIEMLVDVTGESADEVEEVLR